MKKLFITPFILTLACTLPSTAAERSAPVSSGDQPVESNADQDTVRTKETMKRESTQPMNMDEPMPTGMAKKGMKKGDVKTHAKQKEAIMDEMMKQEEIKK
jgi:hypothetical protein